MNHNFNIKYLIYLTIFFIPSYLIKIHILGIPFNLLEILMLTTIFYWTVKNKFHSFIRFKKFIQNQPIFSGIIFLIILGIFISSFKNSFLPQELNIIKSWFILPIIFSFIVYEEIDSKNSTYKLLNTFFYSAFFISIFSLVYLFFGNLTYDFRLKGPFLSPNHLAMFLVCGFLVGFYRIFFYPQKISFNLLFLLPFLVVLFFTRSYATWFALVISFICTIPFFKFSKNSQVFKVAILSLIIFLLFFIFEFKSDKLNSLINFSERSSASSRIIIWQSSIKILSDNIFIGIGPGNFQEKYLEYQKYFPPYLEWAVPQPHNLFLAFWLQTGLLGIIGFLLLIFFLLLKIKKILTESEDVNNYACLIFFQIIAYTLIHGLVDTPFWKNDLSLFFWITTFLILRLPLKNYSK